VEFDKDRAMKWIESNWTEPRKCPICGSEDYFLLDKVWELREFHGGTLKIGGPVLPIIGLMCNVCGHTILFNAIASRAISKDDSSEAQDE
jgi:hypothetical protein